MSGSPWRQRRAREREVAVYLNDAVAHAVARLRCGDQRRTEERAAREPQLRVVALHLHPAPPPSHTRQSGTSLIRAPPPRARNGQAVGWPGYLGLDARIVQRRVGAGVHGRQQRDVLDTGLPTRLRKRTAVLDVHAVQLLLRHLARLPDAQRAERNQSASSVPNRRAVRQESGAVRTDPTTRTGVRATYGSAAAEALDGGT